jgi:hypothetical protein
VPVVLYGSETSSLTLRGNTEWECLGKGCWGDYLDRGEMKCQECGQNCIMRSFITCTLCEVWLEWWIEGGWDWQGI